MLETAFPSQNAMLVDTLELFQSEVQSACLYDVHIWVPFSDPMQERCVGVEYMNIADGVRGQFAMGGSCVRNIAPPPSPVQSPPSLSTSLPPLHQLQFPSPPPPQSLLPAIPSQPPSSPDTKTRVPLLGITSIVLLLSSLILCATFVQGQPVRSKTMYQKTSRLRV